MTNNEYKSVRIIPINEVVKIHSLASNVRAAKIETKETESK